MDLYARQGKVETSNMSNSIPQNNVELCIMIKSLGNNDQPEQAAELLKRAMQKDFVNVEADLQAFVTLLKYVIHRNMLHFCVDNIHLAPLFFAC
jgi:pentatricopeptide repeat protein